MFASTAAPIAACRAFRAVGRGEMHRHGQRGGLQRQGLVDARIQCIVLYKPYNTESETMTKTISVSVLRERIRSVLNEVGFGKTDYVVEKFGEPVAAVISMEDYRLLLALKEPRPVPMASMRELEMQAIHAMLARSGHSPGTREEADVRIREERDSWGA